MSGERATVARTASVVFSGVFAGFMLSVLVLELTLRGYSASTYAQVREIELVGLDQLATVTLLPALIATLGVVVLSRRKRGLTRSAVALLLLLGVFVVSLTVNVPINQDQLTWDIDAPPADWADDRDRWQLAHVFRTSAALLAFGLVSLPDSLRARFRGRRGRPSADHDPIGQPAIAS